MRKSTTTKVTENGKKVAKSTTTKGATTMKKSFPVTNNEISEKLNILIAEMTALRADVDTLMGKSTKAIVSTDAPKQTKSVSTKAKTPKGVIKVDKNGNQWIREYNEAEYRAMSIQMYGTPKPKKADRTAVYRACGFIK